MENLLYVIMNYFLHVYNIGLQFRADFDQFTGEKK